MEHEDTATHVSVPGWSVVQPVAGQLVARPVTAWLVRRGRWDETKIPWIDLCPVTELGAEHPFFIGCPDGAQVPWALFEWDSIEECLEAIADPGDRAEIREFLDRK